MKTKYSPQNGWEEDVKRKSFCSLGNGDTLIPLFLAKPGNTHSQTHTDTSQVNADKCIFKSLYTEYSHSEVKFWLFTKHAAPCWCWIFCLSKSFKKWILLMIDRRIYAQHTWELWGPMTILYLYACKCKYIKKCNYETHFMKINSIYCSLSRGQYLNC